MMDNHRVLPEIQRASYLVPVLTPATALAQSTTEEVHDSAHCESAVKPEFDTAGKFRQTQTKLNRVGQNLTQIRNFN